MPQAEFDLTNLGDDLDPDFKMDLDNRTNEDNVYELPESTKLRIGLEELQEKLTHCKTSQDYLEDLTVKGRISVEEAKIYQTRYPDFIDNCVPLETFTESHSKINYSSTQNFLRSKLSLEEYDLVESVQNYSEPIKAYLSEFDEDKVQKALEETEQNTYQFLSQYRPLLEIAEQSKNAIWESQEGGVHIFRTPLKDLVESGLLNKLESPNQEALHSLQTFLPTIWGLVKSGPGEDLFRKTLPLTDISMEAVTLHDVMDIYTSETLFEALKALKETIQKLLYEFKEYQEDYKNQTGDYKEASEKVAEKTPRALALLTDIETSYQAFSLLRKLNEAMEGLVPALQMSENSA